MQTTGRKWVRHCAHIHRVIIFGEGNQSCFLRVRGCEFPGVKRLEYACNDHGAVLYRARFGGLGAFIRLRSEISKIRMVLTWLHDHSQDYLLLRILICNMLLIFLLENNVGCVRQLFIRKFWFFWFFCVKSNKILSKTLKKIKNDVWWHNQQYSVIYSLTAVT